MRKGAIILCGGKSSRMGREKATLPFGSELMLQRVVRLVSGAVALENIVVVAAPTQLLLELPASVTVARDECEYLGPLAGLAIGLGALGDRADAAYVTGCDVPSLVPAFVDRMFNLLDDYDIVVPYDGEHYHPLAAVYRTSVRSAAERLLASHRMAPRYLFDEARTREVPVAELRSCDPQLSSLQNLNYEDEYLAALKAAGLDS